MSHSIRTVKTVQIDDDLTYHITTRSDIEDLTLSIRSIGLLHPPILQESSSGFRIISGFRRLRAYATNGWRELPARILPVDTRKLTCTRLAISDNALQRPLNLLEVSRSLNLLSRDIKDNKKLLKTASELTLADSIEQIQKILKLCQLIEPIQQAVVDGYLSLAMARLLGECEAAAASILVKIFRELKLGLNRQRELVTLLTEIAHREDSSVLNVLERLDITDILNSENTDAGFKSRTLRHYLRHLRYPNISSRTETFSHLCKKMALGRNVRLTPPKDFEGTTYSATIRFQNLEELKEGSKRLDEVVRNRGFKNFLES
jgi:ParB family chromosome partitioning protein